MYERLTRRDIYGHAYTNETIYDRGMTSEDGVHFEKHYFENGTSAYDGKPIDRLCDLEDKIEQGKILELPCEIGETVYHITTCEELTEENERLRGCVKSKEEIEAIMRATYEPLVRTIAKEQIDKAVADTVRKMQELIKERCIKGGIYPAFVARTIDQIAKEMLEGENEN